jgi:hypothetical protein
MIVQYYCMLLLLDSDYIMTLKYCCGILLLDSDYIMTLKYWYVNIVRFWINYDHEMLL